jgi:hypothetical protein
MNGEVDFENYEINEPRGSYKEVTIWNPTWGTVKFVLESDITGITIEM